MSDNKDGYPKSKARGKKFEKVAEMLIAANGNCLLVVSCSECPFNSINSGTGVQCDISGFSLNKEWLFDDSAILASAKRYLTEVKEEMRLRKYAHITERLREDS